MADEATGTFSPSVEERQVYRWRRRESLRMGLGREDAELFARSPADLRQLERMLEGGCPVHRALMILL